MGRLSRKTCSRNRRRRVRLFARRLWCIHPRGLLLGHSDGASIAVIYAGGVQDHRIRGLALIAPHFVVEELSVRSIAEIKVAYETTDLKAKLARWHGDADNAFYGWNDAWLNPKFRDWDISEYLAYIRVPVAILQGADDQYGT